MKDRSCSFLTDHCIAHHAKTGRRAGNVIDAGSDQEVMARVTLVTLHPALPVGNRKQLWRDAGRKVGANQPAKGENGGE